MSGERSVVNRMRVPSGDGTGFISYAGVASSGRTPLPSGRLSDRAGGLVLGELRRRGAVAEVLERELVRGPLGDGRRRAAQVARDVHELAGVEKPPVRVLV